MLRKVLAEAMFYQGVALLKEDRARRAALYLALARRLEPQNADFLFAAARAADRAKRGDKAVQYCERALELRPDHPGAHELLTRMFLHGEDYFHVLARIHGHLRTMTYVEIGVETGASLALAAPGTVALGIDPAPAIQFELPDGARIFAETSDDFFAKRDVRAELGGLPVGLALIDGMHHFDFALRDFMNLERVCAPGSTILIHDCFPHDRRTASRERQTAFWSGDVWRLVVLLKKYRPELWISTIAAPPTGLAVVRNLNPSSRFIADNFERLCREFLALDYGYLDKGRKVKLNLIPNDWNKIRELLDRPIAVP